MMAVADLRPAHSSLALLLAVIAGSSSLAACGDSGGSTASGTEGATTVTSAGTAPTGAGVSDTTPTGSASEGATGSSSEPGGTDGATGDTGSTAVTGATGETGVDATTDGGPKLDVGVNDTTGPDMPEAGCRKVDFLFVIDNSGSMSDEQQNLIQSFPTFISTIQKELKDAQDYHIMVVDTDAYVFAGCELICSVLFNTCPMAAGDYTCGVTQPEMCEDVIGAGVTHPRGENSSSKDCAFTSGARYMDISEPDLTDAFACAARVGTGSTDDPEKPMQAIVNAVAPKGPSADCNLGFLRPDAILVVTFITDEDDNPGDGSLGTPDGWKASLVAAKKGDESALVVLGLFGDNDQVNSICPPFNPDQATGAEPSARLRQFVTSFGERGVPGSVCAPSYEEFFKQAVAIIDSTCDGFVPPPM